jgi:hypothetical protein
VEASPGLLGLSGFHNAEKIGIRGRFDFFGPRGETSEFAAFKRSVLPQSGKIGEDPIETRVEAQQMLIHVYLQNRNSSRDRSIDPNTQDVV